MDTISLDLLSKTIKEMGYSSYENIKHFISDVLNYGDEEAENIIVLLNAFETNKKF